MTPNPPLTPFADELPLPRQLIASEQGGRLTVPIRTGTHGFHRDLPESPWHGTQWPRARCSSFRDLAAELLQGDRVGLGAAATAGVQAVDRGHLVRR